MFLRTSRLSPAPRWQGLAEHVKSLCMSIGIDGEVMGVIATLQNLGSLELVGLPLEEHALDTPSVALPRLQNLRLRGYFPVAFVRQVYGNARRITHLDLGLLAMKADDAAHGETLLIDEQNGVEEAVRIPRLPHSPLWLPAVGPPDQSPALTHLHLIKPFMSDLGIYQEDLWHVPDEYEDALNAEWVSLIRGVAGSLQELVLEHRLPVAQSGVWNRQDPGPIPPGYRYEQLDGDFDFCQTVLPFLAANSSLFPNLKRLELRGIRIDDVPPRTLAATDSDQGQGQGQVDMVDYDTLLRLAFPECQVSIWQSPYPIHVFPTSSWSSGPSLTRYTVMQDDGDGLLWGAALYNDYRKRFGPPWANTNTT